MKILQTFQFCFNYCSECCKMHAFSLPLSRRLVDYCAVNRHPIAFYAHANGQHRAIESNSHDQHTCSNLIQYAVHSVVIVMDESKGELSTSTGKVLVEKSLFFATKMHFHKFSLFELRKTYLFRWRVPSTQNDQTCSIWVAY